MAQLPISAPSSTNAPHRNPSAVYSSMRAVRVLDIVPDPPVERDERVDSRRDERVQSHPPGANEMEKVLTGAKYWGF